MPVFYFFAVIVIFLGILSLRNGVSFAGYVRNGLARKRPDYAPCASVLAPCRGLEEGMRENLAALCNQDYPAYEIIFITDSADDPSLGLIKETIHSASGRPGVRARVVIAGEAVKCGQKVHNLKMAIPKTDPRSEVLVFADSDARPDSQWLKSLVAPLGDNGTGATTGYRWFVPRKGNLASHLRSVWNASIASALGPDRARNFCWGGSTAIRRSTFEDLHITDAWRGTVSDDFAMTRVLQKARLPIHFVPACLVPSVGDCSIKELFEFTNRQLKITRVYASHLWRPLLIGSLLFTGVFFGGLALVIVCAVMRLDFALPLLLLLAIFAFGAAKALIRFRAVASVLDQQGVRSGSPFAHVVLWPVASALFLWNAVVAGLSRRITWRGITYELKSDHEAVIINSE